MGYEVFKDCPDLIVKGKSGSCSFKATSAKQTDGKISGVLKSGCMH